jgi:hypothetical protein
MEPKLIIDSVQKKVQKLKGSPYQAPFLLLFFSLGVLLFCASLRHCTLVPSPCLGVLGVRVTLGFKVFCLVLVRI